eukprot:g15266.t1
MEFAATRVPLPEPDEKAKGPPRAKPKKAYRTPKSSRRVKKKREKRSERCNAADIDTTDESTHNAATSGALENSPEAKLLPEKHYSHLRCVQKLSYVHSTLSGTETTPSPTNRPDDEGDEEFEYTIIFDDPAAFKDACTARDPRPPAGSPPRSGRTPSKWQPNHQQIAALTTRDGEERKHNQATNLFRETKMADAEENLIRRKNAGRSKQKENRLRRHKENAMGNVPLLKIGEQRNRSRDIAAAPTSTKSGKSRREKSASPRRKGTSSRRRRAKTMSQAPSPSASPHQRKGGSFLSKQPKLGKDENVSPNVGRQQLLSSPSSDEKVDVEGSTAKGFNSPGFSTPTSSQRSKRSLGNARKRLLPKNKASPKARTSSTQAKGPIKLLPPKRTPKKKIGPDTRSSRLPPPKSPYSHLRCVQNLHIINSPPKEESKKLQKIEDGKQSNSSVVRGDKDVIASSPSLRNTTGDNSDNPDEIEAVLVAGKMKPNPCIALHYRDKHLPAGQLRCLEVQLPKIPKPENLPLKMYIQEYCEYVCHRLCKEAKAFAFIQRNQLRRVVTCLSLKMSKV